MNTQTLLARGDRRNLPQWNAGSPGYLSLNAGSGEPDSRAAPRLAAIFRKYWWLATLLWAIIAIPASIAIIRMVPPEYVAVGSINVAPTAPNPLEKSAEAIPFYNEYLHTQAELMKNPYVLQRATEDIRLSKFDWFRQLADQVGYLRDHVEVNPINSTQNIEISMAHRDPEAATAIVDSVIDAYRRTQSQLEEQNVDKNLDILRGLQKHTEDSLKSAQEQLAKLNADDDVAFSDESRKVMADMISSMRGTQAKLEADRLTLQLQLSELKDRPMPDKATYMASVQTENDPQVMQLVQERNRVFMADNMLASGQATEHHPMRVEYRKQLKTLDDKIAKRRQDIQDAAWAFYAAGYKLDRDKKTVELQDDLNNVEKQIAMVQDRVTKQEASSRDLGNKMVPVAALRDQIADDKDSLKRYANRIEEIENANRAPGRVAPVAPTVMPRTPTVFKRKNYLLAANGLGFFVGMGVLVVMMKLRDKIDMPEDLPNSYQPLVVGTVSHAGIAARGLQGRIRKKILGEEMRLLHANLLPPGPTQRRIMMITSPTPSNGKTSIASQLALALAKSGLEVLLIDGDLRKRDLSTMFDVGLRPGLADLLQGKPPELIRPVELLPNLRLMGAGSKLERNPVELFQRKHFHESLNLLQDKFDCIIIDTPPALVVADARMIARSCDEVLCVVRAKMSSPKDVNQTLDAFARITGKTPKIIINGVEHRQSYYKYKFTYTNHEQDDENPTADATAADSLD